MTLSFRLVEILAESGGRNLMGVECFPQVSSVCYEQGENPSSGHEPTPRFYGQTLYPFATSASALMIRKQISLKNLRNIFKVLLHTWYY